MRRLNPETGEPFKRGQLREDGFRFQCYALKRIGTNGYFWEQWLSPAAWEIFTKVQNKQYKTRYREQRQKIFETLGGKCAHCGENNQAVLDVDHINNDGREEKRKSGRSARTTWKLANGEEDYSRFQLLCRNCNWLKHLANIS